MLFSILSVCHLLPKQLTTHCHDYRVYSNKRRGAYLIFVSPMRRLFEGGAYLKGSYHKDKTFWLYNLIYFMIIFLWLFSRKNWRTRRFWRENWMKERRDILTLNWKTSLLMKIDCWLRTALQRLQGIFIILWKYSKKRCTGAAALIQGRRLLIFPLHVRRLIEGGAYLSKYGSYAIWQLTDLR